MTQEREEENKEGEGEREQSIPHEKMGRIIDTIMWAKSFATVLDSSNKPHSFILRALSIKETNYLNFIYQREYDAALMQGIMTNEQLKQLLEANGLWTQDNEMEIMEWERQEKVLKSQIKDFEFFTIKKKKAQKELKKVKEKIKEAKNYKISLFNHSAETRADEVMRRYMIMLSTENIKEEPYWKTEEDFLAECDFIMVFNLAISYYQNNMFDEKTTRLIARSPKWRVKWNAFKNGADLFGRPIPNWSEMQNYLVYWSQFYDYVYESIDRPSDFIIENDEACDAWVKDQGKKNSSKTKNLLGNKTASKKKDHNEQFIMTQRGDKESIKRVQEMNPAAVRQQLRREYEKIKKEGCVSEWRLRGKDLVK